MAATSSPAAGGRVGGAMLLSQSFTSSSMTELSSLYSMSEDDFDRVASRRVQNMLDGVDSMLYNSPAAGSQSAPGSQPASVLAAECNDWTSTFPHLRVVGRQVFSPVDMGFQLYPSQSDDLLTERSEPLGLTDRFNALQSITSSANSDSQFSDNQNLSVSGKQVTAVPISSLSDGRTLAVESDSALSRLEEEIIAESGDVEEILAIDRLSVTGEDESGVDDRRAASRLQRGLPPVTPVNCLRDTVLSAVFDHIMSQLVPYLTPVLQKLLDIRRQSPGSAPELDRPDTDSWKTQALMLMEPTGDLTHRNYAFSFSPSEASIPEDRMSDTSSFGITAPLHAGLASEGTALNGVLTVRSKALLAREKSSVIAHDILSEESAYHAASVASRPSSSLAALTMTGLHSGSARGRNSIGGRQSRLLPLDRNKSSISQTDDYRRRNLDVLRGHRLPTAPVTSDHHRNLSGIPAADLHVTNTPSSISSVGQSGSSPVDALGGAFSSHPPLLPSSAGSGTVHPASSSSVPRSLLPPISHKRDAASANINRTLPSHRLATHAGGTVPYYARESRLLPGRDREKSLVLDTRPSTTHTVYRADTSFSMNRRPTIVTSRPTQSPSDGVFKRSNRVGPLNVTVTGSGIAPHHHTVDGATPDLVINSRTPELELVNHDDIAWGNLHTTTRRLRQSPSSMLVR